jgi:alkanesulfonate monooxygenase SsuD/methylene tetrahydromethanopterin reductase-like flavin-dependent oxidoreductase (luciferase family)
MQPAMKFGLDVPTTGEYADPRVLAELAAEAEVAGWDGFFVWDVLGDGPVVDPWVALTAIALRSERLRIGLMVLPLARHRPWLVARQLANLDHLSGGRVTCAVGLGHQQREFDALGEAGDARARAARLDEALEVLAGLWTGKPFSYAGEHYRLEDVTILPRPLQAPRVPIWVAGGWPRQGPFRRATRWDGIAFKSVHADERRWLTLDEFRAGVAFVHEQRAAQGPFDIVMSGEMAEDRAEAAEQMRGFHEAGATWWVEEGLGWTLAEFRQRVRGGPPR